MNKDEFRKIFGITQSQPWISKRIDKLEHLLFHDCNTSEKQDLIIELINRFVYLTDKNFIECLKDLSEDIATDPSLNDTNTQVVAMAADTASDSSQYILYPLKVYFEDLGWRNHKQVSRFGQAYKTYQRSKQHKNIVLIDEFVGSGQTVISRVSEIKRVFKDNHITDFSIKVKVIISTEEGMTNAKNAGIDIDAQILLKKGISDFSPTTEAQTKIKLMLEIESMLSDNYKGIDMPSMGYGNTESLYLRDEGNTPNSVFPIFWWPFYKDETSRLTLLTRAMSNA